MNQIWDNLTNVLKTKVEQLFSYYTIQNLYVLTPHFGCPQEDVAQQHIKFRFYHFGF
jgi:hypothetical protein